MQNPVEITFRGMEPSESVERFVRAWADKLDHVFERIERCEVVIEAPHRHRHGQPFRVRIALAIPGPDIVVNRDPAADGPHEDVYVALRDAFRAARRQLEDRARVMRGDVKSTAGPDQGRVTFIDEGRGWGYLDAAGRQVYFHRNSVLAGGIDQLAIGDTVRFTEEPGRDGPQATSLVRA